MKQHPVQHERKRRCRKRSSKKRQRFPLEGEDQVSQSASGPKRQDGAGQNQPQRPDATVPRPRVQRVLAFSRVPRVDRHRLLHLPLIARAHLTRASPMVIGIFQPADSCPCEVMAPQCVIGDPSCAALPP